MPDYGTTAGIGIGIGKGLESFGEAMERRHERQSAARDKQATDYEKQAQDIAANIAQLPGGRDAPEAQPLLQELYGVVQKHNALYPAHETPALVARIQRVFGKQPGAPTPDIRAGLTAGSVLAATPVRQNPLIQQMNDWIAARMQGGKTRAEAMKEFWDTQIGTASAEEWKPTTMAPFVVEDDPHRQSGVYRQVERIKDGKRELATERMPGIPTTALQKKPRTPIGTPRDILNEQGQPIRRQYFNDGTYEDYQPVPKRDTSKQGQLARALLTTGGAKTPQDADVKAAGMVLQAERARQAAAAGVNIPADEMMALVIGDAIAGTTTSFGMGQSAARQAYVAAKAKWLQSGNIGDVLNKRVTFQSLQQSLKASQTQFALMEVNERTASNYFDRIKNLGQTMDQQSYQSAVPVINDLLRTGQRRYTDNPAVNNYVSAVSEALTEYAKVVTGQTGGGRVTDAATNTAHELLVPGSSTATVNNWIETVAKPFMRDRVSAYQQTISDQQNEIRNLTQQGGDSGGSVEELEFGPDGKLRSKKK